MESDTTQADDAVNGALNELRDAVEEEMKPDLPAIRDIHQGSCMGMAESTTIKFVNGVGYEYEQKTDSREVTIYIKKPNERREEYTSYDNDWNHRENALHFVSEYQRARIESENPLMWLETNYSELYEAFADAGEQHD